MITLDEVLVFGMIALAVGFLLRRLWRRLRPSTTAAAQGACGSCTGCAGAAPRGRSCGSPPKHEQG